ncbi:hypothetical protein B0H19DRAFT_78111 [Mycena capillaripes]|nr:hypothetical protein B0H19DRAFT_78111 [Mycena capillaripes]
MRQLGALSAGGGWRSPLAADDESLHGEGYGSTTLGHGGMSNEGALGDESGEGSGSGSGSSQGHAGVGVGGSGSSQGHGHVVGGGSSSLGHMGFAQAGETLAAADPWYGGAELGVVGAAVVAASSQGHSSESHLPLPPPSSQGHSSNSHPSGSGSNNSHSHGSGSHGQSGSTSPSSPQGTDSSYTYAKTSSGGHGTTTPPSSYALHQQQQQLASSSSPRQPPSQQKSPSPRISSQTSSQHPDGSTSGRSSPSLGFFGLGRLRGGRASSVPSAALAQTPFDPSTLPDPTAPPAWVPARRSSLLDPPLSAWGFDTSASASSSSGAGRRQSGSGAGGMGGWRPTRAAPMPSPALSTLTDGSDYYSGGGGDGEGAVEGERWRGDAGGRTGLLRPGLAVLVLPTQSTTSLGDHVDYSRPIGAVSRFFYLFICALRSFLPMIPSPPFFPHFTPLRCGAIYSRISPSSSSAFLAFAAFSPRSFALPHTPHSSLPHSDDLSSMTTHSHLSFSSFPLLPRAWPSGWKAARRLSPRRRAPRAATMGIWRTSTTCRRCPMRGDRAARYTTPVSILPRLSISRLVS